MIFSALKGSAKRPLRGVRNVLRHRPYSGSGRFCPICRKNSSRFGDAGSPPRLDTRCMYCGSAERHRFTWWYLENKTDLFDGRAKRVLHVAPELHIGNHLKKRLGSGYLSADLMNPRAMVKMDITNIQYPDDSFDVIYCSHVLEHVIDDRRAMREFRRVMRPDGWALLLVPITVEKTFEDPSVTEPAERLRVFGQEDHVRCYGPDYFDRLEESGFRVQAIRAEDLLAKEELELMRIESGETIHLCRK